MIERWILARYEQEMQLYRNPAKRVKKWVRWAALAGAVAYFALASTYCVAHRIGVNEGKEIKRQEVIKAMNTHGLIEGHRVVWHKPEK